MKRTFLARRNALLSSRDVSWGVLAVALVAFIMIVRIVLPNFFWHVFSPVFQASEVLGTKSHAFFIRFSDVATLARQKEQLESENAALASENQMLLKKVENLSDLAVRKDGASIIAGVVARPPMSPYDTLMLAAGREDGVALGMEAFGAGGVPVGIVTSVLDDFSRVTLFSSSGVTMSGWVGRENTPLSIVGAGGGAMQAVVARAADVAPGDVVFMPGPGMLPVGSVLRVESDPLSPAVTLRIQPAINPFAISWVELRTTGVATSTPL